MGTRLVVTRGAGSGSGGDIKGQQELFGVMERFCILIVPVTYFKIIQLHVRSA